MGSILLGAQPSRPSQQQPKTVQESTLSTARSTKARATPKYTKFKPLKAVRLQAAVCCICTPGICCLRPRLCCLTPTSFDPNLAP